MQPRMTQPAVLVPEAMDALQSLGAAIETLGVPEATVRLVNLRASQINGCGVCIYGDVIVAKKEGESDERLFGVSAWRDAPWYDDAERAALALTEALTRVADREDPVPDAVWEEAARHYDERQLAGLVVQIASINVWNRLNIATGQV